MVEVMDGNGAKRIVRVRNALLWRPDKQGQFMRMKFFWFPLYPAAYAVTNSWAIHNIWFCLFIAWIAKLAILQYGGLRAHQKATPFFLGLILGEFTVGSLWTIVGILLGIPTYGFYT